MNEENPMVIDNLWHDNPVVLLAGDEELSGLEPNDRVDDLTTYILDKKGNGKWQ